MKRLLLYVLFLPVLASCKEKVDPVQAQFGCLYGTPKLGGPELYIRCIHNDIYISGNNQNAADKVAEKLGIPRVDVSYLLPYTKLRFVQNPKCDCQK